MSKEIGDLNFPHRLEARKSDHKGIQDFATGQRKVSNEERMNARNTVNKSKDIIIQYIDINREKAINTIRIELTPYMISTDNDEKIAYYRLNDLENALFDNKNLDLIWEQIGAEASYNKVLQRSLDRIADKLAEHNNKLKILIRDIFDTNSYNSILASIRSESTNTSSCYTSEQMAFLGDNIRMIYSNSKISGKRDEV